MSQQESRWLEGAPVPANGLFPLQGPMWTSLNSSSVRRVRYDEDSQSLHVQFQSGATYRYANVPPEHYEALLDADSPGSYLHNEIKGHYHHERS